MQQPLWIITKSFAGFSSGELASLAAQQLRRAFKTSKVYQFPLVSGERGTLEQLVTATLGSFLEVEATSAGATEGDFAAAGCFAEHAGVGAEPATE